MAADVGIKGANVRHHFPTKGDLGAAPGRRYIGDGAVYLTQLLGTDNDASWRMD